MLPCTFLWLGLVSLAAAEVADIERQAVEYRRAIRSGEVIVKCDYHDSRAAELHVWWDGDSFRQDVSCGNGYRNVDVWHHGRYLNFSDKLSDNGHKIVATVAFANNRHSVGITKPNDPRRVGMATDDYLNLVHYPLDEFLANPARKNTELQPEALAGRECTLVTITRLNGASVRAWIDPQRGPSVLRMEGEQDRPRGHHSASVAIDLALDEASGIWFPKHARTEIHMAGKPEREEDCAIEVISLNQPIPPEVFTFAGIGVPVGWPVSDHTRPDIGRELAWDGQAVVTVERAADTARAATRTNVIYLVGALVLAAVALVLLWRFFSLRRANG